MKVKAVSYVNISDFKVNFPDVDFDFDIDLPTEVEAELALIYPTEFGDAVMDSVAIIKETKLEIMKLVNAIPEGIYINIAID